MKKFVFWTGIVSVASGAGLQFSVVSALLMPTAQPGMLLHVFGLMAMFLGCMLIFCSRDLMHRGNLVLWEGVLRLAGGGVMAAYGIFGGEGMQSAIAGMFDFAIGIAYLVWLPRYLKVSLPDLLLDRTKDR